MCSGPCAQEWKKRPRQYDASVFWAKVDKSAGDEACWPYTGYVTPDGYGWAYTGNQRGQKTHGAHRQAWINTFGPIPEGKVVCHHCDNRRCCNPSHLFIGTEKDNAHDMWKKGRHPAARLSIDAVREIRRDYRKLGPHKQSKSNAKELAQRYGVNVATITGVVSGRRFAFVEDSPHSTRND